MLFSFISGKVEYCQNNVPDHKDSSPDTNVNVWEKGASYAACHSKDVQLRGSLTVEAAVIIPLFVLALTALLFLIQTIQLQTVIQKALYNQTMKVSGYAAYIDTVSGTYDLTTQLLEMTYIKNKVIDEIGKEYLDNSYIQGGSKGLHTTLGYLKDGILDMGIQYRVLVPFDIFGLGNLSFIVRARCHLWTGDEEKTNINSEDVAYVTQSGTVYHTYRTCTYLVKDVTTTTLGEVEKFRNDNGGKYYECSLCCKDIKEDTHKVYVTKYGTRYHATVSCVNLHNNVYTIEKSIAQQKYPLCSRCKERGEKE